MTPQRTRSDWTLLLSLVLFWGTGFAFIGKAVETIPPASVAAGRIALSAAGLTAIVYARGLRLPGRPRLWLRFAVLALFGNVLPFTIIGWGQERVESGLTGVLMGVMPLTTLVLAHGFVPGERMTAARAVGFVMGFAGVLVLTGPEALRALGGSPSDWLRQLAILGGAVCYAINAVLARHLPPTHPLVAAAATLVVATVEITPLAWLAHPPGSFDPAPGSLGAVVWLGVVGTGLATIIYYQLIAQAGPTFFSLINYMIPLVALGTGVVLLGEQPGWNALVALLLILTGIAVSQRR